MNSIENFISLVPRIKLSIQFPYEQNLKSKFLDTIKQAVNSNVKELILKLENGDIGSSSFPLPSYLYQNSDLEKLNLSMCNFDFLPEIIWYSLKVLKISYTCLDNTYIEIIASGCPVLEEFELCNCWGFSQLDFFDLPKLKKFVLNGIWAPKVVEDQNKTDSLSISAASVEVLEILGNLDHKDLVLEDLTNCIKAKIDYFWEFDEDRRRPLTMKPVFNSLKNVQILTCGTWIMEVASDKLEAEFPYALGNCDCLKLHTPVDYRHQLGIMRFIESCPDVGTLIIDISPSPSELKSDEESDPSMEINTEADNIRRLKFPSGFPFKALKTLCSDERTIYSGLPPFIKYLVDNTTRPAGIMSLSINVDFGSDSIDDIDH